jgi:thiol-disulfide isomerase/thioredoxin
MRPNLLIGSIAAIALLAGVLAQRWAGGADDGSAAEPVVQQPALRDLEGRPHAISEWRGKVLVVNFWASWCEPCREEMPEFDRLQAELGGRGLQFVGVAIDESEAVQDFLKESPVNYPILIGDDGAASWAESLGNKAGVLPFSVVFDREGKPAGTHLGSFRREQVMKAIEPLLGGTVAQP